MRTNKAAIIAAWVLSCALVGYVSFGLGLREGQTIDLHNENVRQDGLQAMHAFNRLQNERHWEDLLTRGCVRQAAKAIDIAKDRDTELLARFFKEGIEQSVAIYVKKRDSSLPDALKHFKSKYGDSWFEDECGH